MTSMEKINALILQQKDCQFNTLVYLQQYYEILLNIYLLSLKYFLEKIMQNSLSLPEKKMADHDAGMHTTQIISY